MEAKEVVKSFSDISADEIKFMEGLISDAKTKQKPEAEKVEEKANVTGTTTTGAIETKPAEEGKPRGKNITREEFEEAIVTLKKQNDELKDIILRAAAQGKATIQEANPEAESIERMKKLFAGTGIFED